MVPEAFSEKLEPMKLISKTLLVSDRQEVL